MPTQELAPKVLAYVQVASAFGKKAVEELTPFKADAEKAAAVRPELVATLLSTENIQEHQKDAADSMLQTHTGSLQLLKSALDRIEKLKGNQKNASDLGVGVDPSMVDAAPEYDSLSSPFVGQRTTEKKASDHAMLSVLNAPGS